jgi:hypothetical protein
MESGFRQPARKTGRWWSPPFLRSPTAILSRRYWESPTPAEFDHVKMAVEEYVREGYFAEREDGCYHWGQERVCI